MQKDNIIPVLSEDAPIRLLKDLCEDQGKIILAVEQLEETQSNLIGHFGELVALKDIGNTENTFGAVADVAGVLSAVDVFSGSKLSDLVNPIVEYALLHTAKHPIVATALATMAAFAGTFAFLEYEMQMGWIPRNNMEDVNRTANTIDEIMAASNPYITPYDAVTKLPAGRRARSTKAKLADSKERRANIAMALETLNNVGEIYAASSPISYGEPATFNDWQNQWFRTLDAQQSITYNNQSSRSSPNVTVNMTNTFPQPIRDPYQVREIGDILADQLKSKLNSGAPLMAPGW